ncbi:MAG: hypothetical protein LUQ21_02115 [Methanothrix sp.]|nr:hypothetical protein [Methanothrix sp.]
MKEKSVHGSSRNLSSSLKMAASRSLSLQVVCEPQEVQEGVMRSSSCRASSSCLASSSSLREMAVRSQSMPCTFWRSVRTLLRSTPAISA